MAGDNSLCMLFQMARKYMGCIWGNFGEYTLTPPWNCYIHHHFIIPNQRSTNNKHFNLYHISYKYFLFLIVHINTTINIYLPRLPWRNVVQWTTRVFRNLCFPSMNRNEPWQSIQGSWLFWTPFFPIRFWVIKEAWNIIRWYYVLSQIK